MADSIEAVTKEMEGVDLDKDKRIVDFFQGAQFNDAVTYNGKAGWCVIKSTVLYLFKKKPAESGTDEPDIMVNIEKAEVKEGDASAVLTTVGNADIRLEAENKAKLEGLVNVIKQRAQEASITHLSPEQEQALQRVTEKLAKDNVTVEGGEKQQIELIRFLKSTKWDENKAAELFTDYRRWRKEFGIEGLKMKDVNKEFMSGKVEVPGTTDRWGRPIVILRPRCHEPSGSTAVSLIQMFAYMFERVSDSNPNQQFSAIVDMSGFSKDNVDLRLPKTIYELATFRYPNTIALICIMNQPVFFTTLYAIISAWFDADFKSKLQLLGSNTQKLHTFVAPESLPVELGGAKEFNYRDWIRLRYKTEGWTINKDSDADQEKQAKTAQSRLVEAMASEPPAFQVLEGCVKSGYLTKESGWMKRYQKQFFVLGQNVIFYYKDDKGMKPEGIIGLSGVQVVDGDSTTKKPYSFLIVTTLRTYFVVAADDAEKKAWMDAIKSQIISF